MYFPHRYIPKKPPTPNVTYRATVNGFINDKIRHLRYWAINIRFYWISNIVTQGQFLVHLVAVEHNLEDYFTKHHPINHHHSSRSTCIIPTEDISNYAYYMDVFRKIMWQNRIFFGVCTAYIYVSFWTLYKYLYLM